MGEAERKPRAAGETDVAGLKTYRRGTDRTISPSHTLAKVRPMMADMGITRLADVTGLDRVGVPVAMAYRPNSRSISVSQGKGIDLESAMASGLMESVESYHAERVSQPLVLGSVKDLSPALPMVDVDRLPRIKNSRFRQTHPLLWIEGRDAMAGEPIWLPFEMVHTNYTLPLPSGSGCFPASTNGLASGNHLLEAVCHGLAEVIERDATTLWNHLDREQRHRTRIEVETVDDADCNAVIEKLLSADLDVAVWETTTDLGVPSFYCLLGDDRPNAHLGEGAGSHPVRSVALTRALTEAVQVRTTYITGARDDLPPDQYTERGRTEKLRQAAAMMRSGGAGRSYADGPDLRHDTFQQDLDWMLDRLSRCGIEQVAVVDLTHEEFGIPVARVTVPGLEAPHDDEDYVPGPRARFAGGWRP